MILTLLVWTYITFICFNWGHLFLQLIPGSQVFYRQLRFPWPAVCLTGLAIVGTLTYWLSIFMPVGLAAHLIMLVPVILYHLSGKRVKELYQPFFFKRKYSYQFLLLITSSVAMVLFLCTHTIIHPDTTMYHAPAIKWMETYKAVPGIVNFDTRLGYQSWWFSVQALFRFSFLVPNNFLFINGCVVCWFLAFVADRINQSYVNYKEQAVSSSASSLLMWIALFIISLVCWTQVRLTAASASPDFIAALYVWAAFYFFFTRDVDNIYFSVLITVLCCTAITAKLSVAIILLLPVLLFIGLIKQKAYKTMLLLFTGGALIISPCIIRNVINSGYPLYPSPVLNVFNPDWKTTTASVRFEAHYIEAYARAPFSNRADTERMIQAPLEQWLPLWWDHISPADKLLLLLIVLLFFWNFFTVVTQIKSRDYKSRAVLMISLAGSCFWFITAPDPRFGTGFLIPLLFSLYTGFYPFSGFAKIINPKSFGYAITCIAVLILAYSAYRGIYFFQPKQLILPLGVEQPDYQKAAYQGVSIYVNPSAIGCGFSPAPCVGNPSPGFILRGLEISEGFKNVSGKEIIP